MVTSSFEADSPPPTDHDASDEGMTAAAAEPDASSDNEAVLTAPPLSRVLIRRRIRADQNGVLIAATLMAVIGWAALYILVVSVRPLALYRWLFFILLYIAVTGTVLPFIWYLNNRFNHVRPVMGGTILREGMWCGLLAITVAWLQMIRAANGALAFFLALSFLVIEIFLRVRETRP